MTATTAFRTEEQPVWPRYRAALPPDITGKTAWTHSITSPSSNAAAWTGFPAPPPAQTIPPYGGNGQGQVLSPNGGIQDAPDAAVAGNPPITGQAGPPVIPAIGDRTTCATNTANAAGTGTTAGAIPKLTAERTTVNSQLTAIAALLPAPTTTLTTVAPATGPLAGGTAVTLTGTGFAAPASVTFNGVAATNVVVVSATSITCVAPRGVYPGVVGVVVTVPAGFSHLSGSFTYSAAAPTLTGCTPAVGPIAGGTNVTLTGTGLGGTTGVTFGGTAATNVVVLSNTTITCTVPAHAVGAVAIVATNPNGTGTLTAGFTYQ